VVHHQLLPEGNEKRESAPLEEKERLRRGQSVYRGLVNGVGRLPSIKKGGRGVTTSSTLFYENKGAVGKRVCQPWLRKKGRKWEGRRVEEGG